MKHYNHKIKTSHKCFECHLNCKEILSIKPSIIKEHRSSTSGNFLNTSFESMWIDQSTRNNNYILRYKVA